ncbi:hypothetical protein RHORCCE3_1639 [Rickettsia hoogstraalii str. RCCE3]|nr:hypothetical protein RHORCCE3_1639 [Rickettsia hoogstraalii str. RCCE3]
MNSKIVYKQLLVLNTKIRFFGKIKVKDHLNALDQIAEFGTPYDVRYIIHHIFSDNHKISRKAASVIRKLLIKPEIMKIWPNLYANFLIIMVTNQIIYGAKKNFRVLQILHRKNQLIYME